LYCWYKIGVGEIYGKLVNQLGFKYHVIIGYFAAFMRFSQAIIAMWLIEAHPACCIDSNHIIFVEEAISLQNTVADEYLYHLRCNTENLLGTYAFKGIGNCSCQWNFVYCRTAESFEIYQGFFCIAITYSIEMLP